MAFFLTLIKVVVCCMLAGGCQSQEPGPAINDALDKVCSSLPADMQAKCTQFVGQYGSRVSANITHLTPEQACEQMGLCQSPAENKLASVTLGSVVSGAKQMAAATPPKLEKMPVDPAVKHCTLCELVLIKINPWLQKNATQVEMLEVMDKVCGILPSSIQKQCTQFVSQYGTQVIDNLLQLSPDQVCASLGLCEPEMSEADKTDSTIGKGDTSAGTDPVHQCILCNVVINKIDSLLVKQNITEEEITAALDKVCSVLPPTIKDSCDNFVNQFGPIVLGLLETPDEICTKIGLCQTVTITAVKPKKVKKKKKKPVDPALKHCTMCELVITKIEPLLEKNSTQAEIRGGMYKACAVLPPTMQPQCYPFISQYSAQFLDNLIQFSPDQVCASLGLCINQTTSMVTDLAIKEHSSSDGLSSNKVDSSSGKDPSTDTDPIHQCILCNVVIDKIGSLLAKKNFTEAEMTAALDKVCSVLPPTIKDSCDNFVSQFGPMVLGLLETPDEICTKIGLCQTVTITAVKPKKVKKKKKKPVDPALKHCTMCELVITKIEPLLEKNSTQAEIHGGMYKACAVLPPTMQPQCYPFISQYSAQFLDNLIQFSPDQVCVSLGLCINQTTSMVTDQAIKEYSSSDGLSSNKVDSSSGKDPSTDADPIHQCILCNVVINKIGSLLAKKNFTEEEITAALDKVCSVLPPTIKDSCDNFVSQFGPMVLGLLENPEEVCTRISLCQPEIDPMKPAFSQAKLSSPESTPKFEATVPGPKQCALCEVIMSKIGQRILKNSSEADLVPAMLKVCDTLSPTIQTQCINFVNQYGIFIHKLDPEQVCAYLGVCEEVANNESSPSKEADPSGHQCVLCELIISKINTFLTKKNLTQEEMTAALDKVCSVLPPTIKDSCDNFVSQFGVLITDLLGNPDQVCAKMGLCIITPAETMKMSVPIAGPAGPKDCLLCEFIIAKLQELLPTNSTKVQAEEVPLTAASMTTAASGEEGDVQTTSAVEPTAPATAPREEDAPDTHLENGMISLVVLGVLFAIACSISLVVSVIRGEQQPGYRFRSGRRSLHGVRRYFPVAPPHSGCRAENHPLLTA